MPTPLRLTPRQAKRLQANVQPDDVSPDTAPPAPRTRRRDFRSDLLKALEGATGLRRRLLLKALERMDKETKE